MSDYSKPVHARLHQPHKFEADAQVVPEVEILQHVDDIVSAVLVLLPDVIQDANFYKSLVMEALLIPDDLDGHVLVGHVVQGAYHLAKASFADHLEDLVPIGYVIVQDLDKLPPLSMFISVLLSRWWSR